MNKSTQKVSETALFILSKIEYKHLREGVKFLGSFLENDKYCKQIVGNLVLIILIAYWKYYKQSLTAY